MKVINAAILGAGGMGKVHGNNLSKIEGVKVVSVCDFDLTRAKALSDLLGAKAYDNLDDMLAGEPIEVLYICLPPFAHDGQFEKAAGKGMNIFIEKPIAITSKRGESMVEAACKAGIKTQVGFHMRYGSAVGKLRKMIANGEAGRPVLFNGRYQCNSLHSPWWIDVNKCGGQIFEQAIHVYDMCRYMFGNPKAVAGFMGNTCHAVVPGYTVEDVSASVSGFTTGATAAITATNCAVPGRWDAIFDVVFENVSVFFQNPDEAEFHYMENGSQRVESFNEPSNQMLLEDIDFIDIVRNDRVCVCPVEEGLRSLYYVEAVVTSAKLDGKKILVSNC